MKKSFNIFHGLIFILAGLLFFLPFSISAQVMTVDSDPDLYILNLDEDDQDLAEEYLDIIEQLQEIIEDYEDYLSDIEETAPCDDKIDFELFEEGLSSGLYAEDIMALKKDIEEYADDLKKIQTSFRKSDMADARDCYRLIRSLRRELSILNDLIDQNITNRFVMKLKDAEFQNYLRESILKVTEKLLSEKDLAELDKQLQELGHRLDDIEEFEIPPIPTIPAIPETPENPSRPDIRILPRVETRISNDRSGKESGLAKVYTALQSVEATTIPVNITNPIGGVIILGDNTKQIEAVLNIEVAADSRSREKDFAEATTLEINSESDGYFVNVSLPRLTDPHTKILSSQLTVNVPSKNHIICKSSFGPIKATGLNNGLNLEASYADITLADIRGDVNVSNSMNPVELRNIYGNIEISNSYNTIKVFDCTAERMNITNAYSQVSVYNSSGEVVLRNSGLTEIKDHNGNVDIDNSYGIVKVDNLYGDLKALNAYSPIETSEIRGAVTLGNIYSLIAAVDIDGSLEAQNKYGKIDARYLNGPINLINENGDITVVIENPLKGASSISTTSGTATITLDSRSNIFLKAQTTGGEIKSFYPLVLTDRGNLLIGELTLGKGKDSLSITGNNSKIIIDESR
ncbi:MAG: DUF4097 family beta strand repeat protein [candidate division Zixibacteria bacterium]|nr:DUF4097 family beta strand repeat protein [candidate division Zixibacteria bacterium]